MIVTEEQAKTMRCQEAFPAAGSISHDGEMVSTAINSADSSYRFGGGGHGGGSWASYTSVQSGGAPVNCITTRCMAWCWISESNAFEFYMDQSILTSLTRSTALLNAGWLPWIDGESPPYPFILNRVPVYYRANKDRLGYCGKAHKR